MSFPTTITAGGFDPVGTRIGCPARVGSKCHWGIVRGRGVWCGFFCIPHVSVIFRSIRNNSTLESRESIWLTLLAGVPLLKAVYSDEECLPQGASSSHQKLSVQKYTSWYYPQFPPFKVRMRTPNVNQNRLWHLNPIRISDLCYYILIIKFKY